MSDEPPDELPDPPTDAGKLDDRFAAMVAFDRAAHRLITQHRPPEEWTEAERLGMGIVSRLLPLFQGATPDDALPSLRRALVALDGSDAVCWRSFHAVRVVTEWAERWRLPENRVSAESRAWVLDGLVRELSTYDEAFTALALQHAKLASLLDCYDPRPQGKRGRKGSVRIVVDLILDCGLPALDIHPTSSSDIDELRRTLDDRIEGCRAAIRPR